MDIPAHEWVVVDVETSGLSPRSARILSIAAIPLSRSSAPCHEYSQILNPGVDPGPVHIHGITRQIMSGKPQFGDIIDQLYPLLTNRILVAHNVRFDYSFLAAEAQRTGTKLPINHLMCTIELSKQLGLELKNYRLDTLACYWGIPQHHHHDALNDAQVTAQILTHSLQRAQQMHISLPIHTLS